MSDTGAHVTPAHHHRHVAPGSKAGELAMAVSLLVGRGRVARLVADLAAVSPADRVVDVGCGPGTAVREAARRGAEATGVDPSPVALGLARAVSRLRRRAAAWSEGSAESLPLPDGSATVAWAISSAHHWADRRAGIAEIRRVLVPGGRLVVAEPLALPGSRGHAAHGLTATAAEELAAEVAEVGFDDVASTTTRTGRRTRVVVTASRTAT